MVGEALAAADVVATRVLYPKIRTPLSLSLAAAVTTLLPDSFPVYAAEAWEVDAEVLVYEERDGRVSDTSFKSIAQRVWSDEGTITLGVQVDSLSGASPTGAILLEQVQTITQPSGNASTISQPGELPIDDTFQDTRAALTASVSNSLSSTSRYTSGLSISNEYDYLHLGINASYARDFNQKKTTLSAGVAIAQDSINPVGGAPTPLSFQWGEGITVNKEGDKRKSVVDGLFGITQIINRRSLMQLNYSLSIADGYLNDPYKILTVLDDNGDPVDSLEAGMFQYRYESRPDSRIGHNLYTDYKYRFDAGILSVNYRFHTDDWGIDSHTVEARYRWLMSDKHYLEPNVRYYSQGAADFYRTSLAEGEIPEFASSDYRLGEFTGLTLGLTYHRKIGANKFVGATVETYQTDGTASDAPAGNGETRSVAYPDLNATNVRLRYSFTR